jgi:acyl-coenzyme A thioesterase PaaI-like protein
MADLTLVDDQNCFACGKNNPDGLGLNFEYPEPGRSRTEFTAARKFQGWQGVLHGGIVSTMLDEAMAHALGGPTSAEGLRPAGGSELGGGGSGAVTAELVVRFKKPVPVGARIVVEGSVVGSKGRVVEASAEVRDSEGIVLASATGKLVKPKA